MGQLLSKALETHLGYLIKQIFAMTRQRTDTDRTRPGMVLTNNLRKKLHEINTREREKQKALEAKEAEEQQVSTLLPLPGHPAASLACGHIKVYI